MPLVSTLLEWHMVPRNGLNGGLSLGANGRSGERSVHVGVDATLGLS
jgi:hypothetical protein